jgi:hypothetical protein
MITQLSTVKARLQMTEVTYDDMLTNVIAGYSDRFDRICNRKFGRQVNAVEEFPADQMEICPVRWPIESVASFDLKTKEADGWQAVTPAPSYLVRNACVVSLNGALGCRHQQGRVTYTGGYVLPGTTVGAGQTALPSDIEQACVEQVAYWFENHNTIGIVSSTATAGTRVAQVDLLPGVVEVLKKYTRVTFDQ